MPELEFRALVANSDSYAAIMRYFQMCTAGSSFKILKRRIQELSIDASHITNVKPHERLIKHQNKPISLTDILTKNTRCQSSRLKIRLVKCGLLKDQCEMCGLLPIWNGMPITLQLDHRNGDHEDNRIENLRVICPNCHTQTSNYGSKNWNGKFKTPKKSKEEKSVIYKTAGRKRWKFDPPLGEFIELRKRLSLSKMAVHYGVTRNVIILRCRSLNIKKETL